MGAVTEHDAHERPFWRDWRPGERVVVRYRLPTPDEPAPQAGQPHLTDALGDVLVVDEHGVTVRTRGGDVTIAASAITLGKRVPPPPPRRRRASGH